MMFTALSIAGDVVNPQKKFYGLFVGYNTDGYNQAKEVRDKLVQRFSCWKVENAKMMDKGTATKQAIKDAIDSFKGQANSGDEFLFYYVGHGGNGALNDPDRDTELKGDDVINPADKNQILPGEDGKLDTQPDGDDDSEIGVGDTDGDEAEIGGRFDAYIIVDGDPNYIYDDELAEWLSGFKQCVSIEVFIGSCYSWQFWGGKNDLKKLKPCGEGSYVQFVGFKAIAYDELSRGVIKALEETPQDGTATHADIAKKARAGATYNTEGDNDNDTKVDEDGYDYIYHPNLTVSFLMIDNDLDGSIDEDPEPVTILYSTPSRVGGVVATVDKLTLLAPHICSASIVLVATTATAIYVKRLPRKKRSNENC